MTKTKRTARSSQGGMSLVELMIASFVLMVGVLACAVLIPLSIGANSRNRQQSNSTVLAQMVMEKIMSVPAGSSPTLTLTDCANSPNNINTAGSAGAGSGAPLLASGDVDFSAAAPAGYSMLYTTCGTFVQKAIYDVRWNIQAPSSYVKLITVSAKLRGAGTDLKLFSLPVTIRSMAGQGS